MIHINTDFAALASGAIPDGEPINPFGANGNYISHNLSYIDNKKCYSENPLQFWNKNQILAKLEMKDKDKIIRIKPMRYNESDQNEFKIQLKDPQAQAKIYKKIKKTRQETKGRLEKSCVPLLMELKKVFMIQNYNYQFEFVGLDMKRQQAIKLDPSNPTLYRAIYRYGNLLRSRCHIIDITELETNYTCITNLDQDCLKCFLLLQSEKCGQEIFSFLVETMDKAVKSWHETSNVDPRVYFLLDKDKTDTEKYAPAVNIDKAFESPQTHSSCFPFLRQYAEESFSRAACLVVPKSIISYPQVWKGQGSRKWKHGQNDGFFVQFESPSLRKIWFIPSSTEKGQTLCRDPVALDIGVHEILPRVFKEA
ncbi:hypothetical protein BUALT_Bualt12G0135300 [Buddleja alternifolia]|uniref:Uncharacterized protein n=1 Tax=Buddleja alternifolia TaxID=168488 RepID=A0AAV6WSC4_9LAMI|nr:hypothetical protein BUALT_Bualt12G0135300 [Buddleja alternifolia]